MDAEVLHLAIAAPDTVAAKTGSGVNFADGWGNTTNGYFVLEQVDLCIMGASGLIFGALVLQPAAAPFFWWHGDSSTSLGLSGIWTGRIVVSPGQAIDWNFSSTDPASAWGAILSGHWELGYRPSF